MRAKRTLLVIITLLLLSLSCNFVARAIQGVTPTPVPTATARPTATPVPLPTGTPEPTPLSNDVNIPESCQSQPLATIPAATTVAQPTPSLGANPEISKDVQLRVFEDLVGTINKVYLYPDFNGVDWKGTVASYRAKIKAGLDTETFYNEMSKLLAELKDEHSQFQSPLERAASDAELAGKTDFVGVGIYAGALPEKKRVTILAVFPDSPAEQAGLKPHDSILAADGIPLISDGKVYMQYVRGPICSAVVLTVQSPGEAPRDVMLVRYRITAPFPIDARLVTTRDGSKIGYILLPTFFDETIPDQVRTALDDFGTLDGLILDNRMNHGGSSNVVEPVLSYFTHGLLGNFVTRKEKSPFSVNADPINNSQDVPLVVLVGTETVSFGEIFAGVLQDTGRAKVVGQTTLGNVEVLNGYDFEDGSLAWIAHQRFDPRVSHANWEKDGIIPDVQAFADWDTFTFDTDPGVAAAVKLLGHQ